MQIQNLFWIKSNNNRCHVVLRSGRKRFAQQIVSSFFDSSTFARRELRHLLVRQIVENAVGSDDDMRQFFAIDDCDVRVDDNRLFVLSNILHFELEVAECARKSKLAHDARDVRFWRKSDESASCVDTRRFDWIVRLVVLKRVES